MAELLAKAALAYILGTVMGGDLIGKLRGVNLRTHGSGNVGATNALRTQGRLFGIAVLLIDVLKGVLAVLVLPALPWPLPGDAGASAGLLPWTCGGAAALGHVFPAWYGFRGGKGAATLAGIFGALLPVCLGWMAAAFFAVLVLTGYVGLATVTAALTGLLYVTCFHPEGAFNPMGAFTLSMAILVAWTHRHNLQRVWAGTENRFERVMLGRRLQALLKRHPGH